MSRKYWEKTGLFQELYNKFKALIPESGKADSMHIELLRCASNLYYDFYNNGAGNLSVYEDQIFFIALHADVIKERMVASRRENFDKLIAECLADAADENRNYVSAMFENNVVGVVYGLEAMIDAIVLLVEELEQDKKFILVEANLGMGFEDKKEIGVAQRARNLVPPKDKKRCDKWFEGAQPGDCLFLGSRDVVFCVGKRQTLKDIKC